MKICLFTPSFLPKIGGTELSLDRLARELIAMGHEIVVLAKTPRGMGAAPDLPYPVIYYPRHRSSLMLGVPMRALLSAHRQHQFDIVHAVMLYPTAYVATRLRKKLGIPIIASSRGDVMPGRRHTIRWLPRRRMCQALRKADAVIAMSKKMQAVMHEMVGDNIDVEVIHNGVDAAPDKKLIIPARFAELTDRRFILTLGRLNHHKGLNILLDALAGLQQAQVEVPLLVIAGDGKERHKLEQQVLDSGLSGQVIFAGGVFDDDKAWLLQNCMFFLQPSVSEGGIPNTVLEAISYGKAIIGTEAGGIPDIVSDDNGDLVPSGDVMALQQSISAMLTNQNIHELESASVSLAKSMGWERVARQHLHVYEDAIRNVSAL